MVVENVTGKTWKSEMNDYNFGSLKMENNRQRRMFFLPGRVQSQGHMKTPSTLLKAWSMALKNDHASFS